ncbi:energy-coupling factor transporter transmembrane component T [Aeropyrum camini]|uniref:energy-coupling factor transporter transmembrane component T n=1 Tax=Aeropyrum camini TaxID=229980 RepID=UPI000787AF00|nr:energy-coupling factor transporter transmembrane component T [Aeropyrum camini]
MARLKPRPWALFIYGVLVTVIAIVGSGRELLATFLITGVPGFLLGLARYRFLVLLIPLTVIGTFLNALAIYYTGLAREPGEVVAKIWVVEIPQFAVETTAVIALRVFSFAGAGLLLVSLVSPRDALRSLTEELGLPKGLAFSLAFALRLFPLIRRDLSEVMAVRRLRGYRTIPISPGDYMSIIAPLLNVSLERAVWVGISAELRGFRLRRVKRRLVLGLPEAVLAVLLAVQAAALFVL